jgi:hypothetical protein
LRESMIRTGQTSIQQARRAHEAILLSAVNAGVDLKAPMKLAILQNEIAQLRVSFRLQLTFLSNSLIPIKLSTIMNGGPTGNATET